MGRGHKVTPSPESPLDTQMHLLLWVPVKNHQEGSCIFPERQAVRFSVKFPCVRTFPTYLNIFGLLCHHRCYGLIIISAKEERKISDSSGRLK